MNKQVKSILILITKPLALVGTLILFLSLTIAACSNEPDDQGGGFPSPMVSVANVVVRDVIPWEKFNGRIEATEVVQLRARVKGVVENVAYKEGSVVSKGALLFSIDPKPFRTELKRAKADLARIRAQASLAQLESQRAKNLVKRKLLSQDEYDKRVATENQENANVRSAEASVELAQLNLSYTQVRSPIDGRTGQALMTKGNLISSDPIPDLLTTIRSLDPMYVVFNCDERTYLNFFMDPSNSTKSETDKLIVLVGLDNETGFPRKGHVDFIDNKISSSSGTIRIRAVLDNKDHTLIPGLYAQVKVLANQSVATILIQEQAILTDQDRKYVYVLDEDNHAIRKDIKIGRKVDGLRIVSEGLTSDDKIIVYGIQKIFFPNMLVVPQNIRMGDPPPSAGSKPVELK